MTAFLNHLDTSLLAPVQVPLAGPNQHRRRTDQEVPANENDDAANDDDARWRVLPGDCGTVTRTDYAAVLARNNACTPTEVWHYHEPEFKGIAGGETGV